MRAIVSGSISSLIPKADEKVLLLRPISSGCIEAGSRAWRMKCSDGGGSEKTQTWSESTDEAERRREVTIVAVSGAERRLFVVLGRS